MDYITPPKNCRSTSHERILALRIGMAPYVWTSPHATTQFPKGHSGTLQSTLFHLSNYESLSCLLSVYSSRTSVFQETNFGNVTSVIPFRNLPCLTPPNAPSSHVYSLPNKKGKHPLFPTVEKRRFPSKIRRYLSHLNESHSNR